MEQAAAEPPQVNVNSHVCVTGLSKYGVCGAAQCCDEPYACCIACPKDCNGRCGWLPKVTPQPVVVCRTAAENREGLKDGKTD